MDLQVLGQSLSLLERKVLPHVKATMSLDELVTASKLQEVEVRRALLWLSNRKLVSFESTDRSEIILLENGKIAAKEGLPELRILKKIEKSAKLVTQLVTKTLPQGEIMASIGVLKNLKAADVEKTDKGMKLKITASGKVFVDGKNYPLAGILSKKFPLNDEDLSSEEKELVKQLSKRKDFLKKEQRKDMAVTLLDLGKQLQKAKINYDNLEEQLTADMIKTGSWKKKKFRLYDVESPVPAISGGRRHPTREATNIIRDIYLQMGFQEMSGPWVETAFWCMDSMWIPQDHPARDVQDTFYVEGAGELPEAKLVKKVKKAHEDGLDTGSTGYGTKWSEDVAKQLLLRTHSTATSFRKLAEIGNKDGKYFYVANVFRNEAVDTTHLAEFLQAEGFVVGDGLTLSDLMGFIKEFYARLGIHKIRFKPTYNPYTEPSLEAHYYDEKKQKWYALINSGIFRPESLAPYGIKKTVIAWGMGASRVAALLNHKNNLRELVGPTVSFDWIATHQTPQPRLDE